MPVPVLTAGQMLAWENASWAGGAREKDVIARVGERVASKIRAMSRAGDRVVMLAGRGHNGDDVRAAVPLVADRDLKPINAFNPAHALSDLAAQLASPRRPVLIVDGVFGTGLDRDLSPEWIQLFAAVNASDVPVLAVDIPSGLDADTGRPRGGAVRATVTLTIGAPKQGLLREGAWEHVGRLEVATDIGLSAWPEALPGAGPGSGTMWTMPEDFAGFPPARSVVSHKGSFGHLVIIAGSSGHHGSAVLAARGAGGTRPGLVTVVTSPDAYVPVASQICAPMVKAWSGSVALPEKISALLVGPGLAGADVPAWLRAQVVAWWRDLPVPMVADASALDWLAEDVRRNGPVLTGALRVITPHPGEAKRIIGDGPAAAGRPEVLRAAAAAVGGCHVVLKGHQTLVAGPALEDLVFVNPSGNPGLAQGGSGDVLAGFLAGLLAQPPCLRDPLLAIRYAVWQHGRAADALEAVRQNWTSEDLAAVVGETPR